MKRTRRVGRHSRARPESFGHRVTARTDDRYDERLRKSPRDRARVGGRELSPAAVLADEGPKRPERELAPFRVAGERRQAQEAQSGERVLVDRPLSPRQASGLVWPLRRVEEAAERPVFEVVADPRCCRRRKAQRQAVFAGFVRVEQRVQPRRGVAEQIRDSRSGRAVDVVKRTIADQALLDRAQGRTRALRGSSIPEGERRGVVGGRSEGVPARVDRGIDEWRSMLRTFLGGQRVVVLVSVLGPSERLNILAPERRVHPADHVAYDAVVARRWERAMCLGVDRKKLSVVLEHLLVVRDLPLPRRRVAKETTFDLVAHPTRGHRGERLVEHRRELRVTEATVLVEHETKDLGLRELRLAAEASELRIVLTAHEGADGVDDLPGQISALRSARSALLLT